jgi:D-gamma-glutamyl-meso-diaminopimelic acid endopeptidase CwlS
MDKYRISRKERRKAEQSKLAYGQLKKGTTVLSSAVVVSSIAAPIAAPKIAEAAEEQPTAEISYSDTTHTQNAQDVTGTSNDSIDTQTTADEEPTSDTSSEVQEPSESNTSETIQSTEPTETADSTATTDTKATEASASTELKARSSISTFSAATRNITPSAFISEIAGHASTAAAASDLYASVMIAQAILESDWGRSTLSAAPNYNLFGIKGSYQGQSVYMKTWEVINGQNVYIDAAFRKYPSPLESFYDNAYVLKNTSFQSGVYYYAGTWKSNTRSYKDATACLTGRYATDPNYGTKLNNIIESYGLTQYDTPASGSNSGSNNSGNTNTGNTTNTNTGSNSSSNTYHTVKAGDSLWALASKYGTTIANIKSWNNLSSDMIYVGQKLIVKKGSSSNSGSSTNNSSNNSSSNNNSNSSNTTSGSNTYYTVKSGDSLWAISNANGVSIANLRQWNNLSGDIIYPGQKLIVKKGASSSNNSNNSSNNTSSSSSNNNNSSNTSSTNSYYTVKSGDSLWAIANANGTSIANLRQWNSLSGDIIYPGQKLIVKKGSGSSNSSSSSSNTSSGSTNNANTSASNASASYTVKSGDSLWAIANANGVSVANLRQWNSLSGDIIYPGQKLVVKKGGSTNSSASSSSSQSSSQSGKTHVVKSGNTLWGLAQQYGTSVQKLKQLNNLASDIIYIGQTLKVK